jgi:hypothetical protein
MCYLQLTAYDVAQPSESAQDSSLTNSMRPGQSYSLYLTPTGNQTYTVSRTDPFALRTVTRELLGGANSRPAAAGMALASVVAGLALAAVY